MSERLTLTLLLATTVIASGCSPSSSTPSVPSETPAPLGEIDVSVDESGALDEKEYWDLVHVGGAPVGHTVTKIRRAADRDNVEIEVDTAIAMQRFGAETRQSMSIRSVESTGFRIRSVHTKMSSGEGHIESDITNDGRQLLVTTRAGGQITRTQLPADCLGVIAVEQDLLRRPLKIGQSRNYRQFIPFMNTVAEVRLVAVRKEPTSLLNGVRELLRVENTITLAGGNKIALSMWTNDRGEVVKTDMAGLQTTYRTTKEIATAKRPSQTFDLGVESLVTIDSELTNPHGTSRITYRATIVGEDPVSYFPEGSSQSVKRIDGSTAEIVVRAIRPDTDDATDNKQGTSPEYLASNSMIQVDDPEVRALAERVPSSASTWELACSLEKLVGDLISEKNFSTAFASASEVAKTKAGDCTEHSVLLCALCRAKQIPARCVVGLVYYSPSRAFAYHMWSEVWIDGKWIPLDATLGLGGIGAAHIKVSDTSLADGSGLESMLPVIQLIGKLQLEIVDVGRK